MYHERHVVDILEIAMTGKLRGGLSPPDIFHVPLCSRLCVLLSLGHRGPAVCHTGECTFSRIFYKPGCRYSTQSSWSGSFIQHPDFVFIPL